MAMQILMYEDLILVLEDIVYMLAFAVATILVTVRLYDFDIQIIELGQNKMI